MEDAPRFVGLWSSKGADNNSYLHALTADSYRRLPFLERPYSERALEDLLPEQLLPSIRLLRDSPGVSRFLFLLDRSLPKEWTAFDWEMATLDGQVIGKDVLVVRHARASFGPLAAGTDAACRYLDIFPTNEFDFTRALQPLILTQRLGPCRQAFLHEHMSGTRELFILAHGDDRGLLGVDGKPYQLPQTKALPEKIWLLACNRGGALHELARKLLDRGVRTVIVATGELSAREMVPIIEQRLATPEADDPATWLATAGKGDDVPGGAWTLAVWGEIRLSRTSAALWNGLTWQLKMGERLRLPLDDEISREEFISACAVLDAEETWPLTREWMLPPLLWLAEKYDQRLMREFERRLGPSNSQEALRGLAAAARRVGHYPQMARHLARALGVSGISGEERAEHLGALANLLIDLDLPESADHAIVGHEDCLIHDTRARQIADFKRLDWKSRGAARQGYIDIAIDHMTKKRKRAELDAGRELASQLYLAAWGMAAGLVDSAVAESYAIEVEARLLDISRDAIGFGNETAAYLLRALAAHAWASRDVTLLDKLRDWQSLCEERLSSDDPGPWAYTLVFLHIAGCASGNVFLRAMEALTDARYFLEVAMFFGLSGQVEGCDRALHRFQERRRATLKELGCCIDASGFDPAGEAERRGIIENDARNSAADMVSHGVLPL